MNDDIETIRKLINNYWPAPGEDPRVPEADAALERVEDELEELRDRVADSINRENDTKAEVERLRKDFQNRTICLYAVQENRDQYKAEVEKLRGAVALAESGAKEAAAEASRHRAEVERLLNELKLTQEELMKEQDENDGLREELEGSPLLAEVRRLRFQKELFRTEVETLREENERLRAIKRAARSVLGLYNVDKEYGIDSTSPEWGRLRNALAEEKS